ncbi:hypothetical protein [Thalassovita taeanensis]|uniref:hypothetical protein n=1 Tax=Thalassovita taeanensis TaxID=657014 RepID=UPI0011147ADA|nr:hypothetical protein [Thalassovita taeanensis]
MTDLHIGRQAIFAAIRAIGNSADSALAELRGRLGLRPGSRIFRGEQPALSGTLLKAIFPAWLEFWVSTLSLFWRSPFDW